MRLSKYLAQAGIASRRQAEKIILAGQVKVNGIMINELGTSIDPLADVVEYNNKPLHSEELIYLLLNKPTGVISSVVDARGRKTVIDLIPDISQRVYPVGRLDYDTSGLLLLSNDGEFTNLMIHPRYKMEKTYQALVRNRVSEEAVKNLREGVLLEDNRTAPAQVKVLNRKTEQSILEITIHEGRNRQVRRMCAAVGHPVLQLTRTRVAFLTLDGVRLGEYRHLKKSEMSKLCDMAGKPN